MTKGGETPPARTRRGPSRPVLLLLTLASLLGGLSLVAVSAPGRSDADEVASDLTATTTSPRAPASEPTTSAALPSTTPPVAEIGTHSAHLDDLPTGVVAAPTRITIDDIDVDAAVSPAGVVDGSGALDVPSRSDAVVWYRFGPTPGATGGAVIAGHVDYDGVRGSFFRLTDLAPGAFFSIDYDDGSRRRFQVVDRRSIAKVALPTDEIFDRRGPPRLTLITCGGSFDPSARSYRDNVVVQAVPVTT